MEAPPIRPEVAAVMRRCAASLDAAGRDAELAREALGDGVGTILVQMIDLPRAFLRLILK